MRFSIFEGFAATVVVAFGIWCVQVHRQRVFLETNLQQVNEEFEAATQELQALERSTATIPPKMAYQNEVRFQADALRSNLEPLVESLIRQTETSADQPVVKRLPTLSRTIDEILVNRFLIYIPTKAELFLNLGFRKSSDYNTDDFNQYPWLKNVSSEAEAGPFHLPLQSGSNVVGLYAYSSNEQQRDIRLMLNQQTIFEFPFRVSSRISGTSSSSFAGERKFASAPIFLSSCTFDFEDAGPQTPKFCLWLSRAPLQDTSLLTPLSIDQGGAQNE